MKKTIMAAGLAAVLTACGSSGNKTETMTENPLLTEFKTPFGVPPFDKIELDDYMPAFKEGIAQQQKEVEEIVKQKAAPDFENTIVALDQSGDLLRKVSAIFYGLNSANTNDEMQALSRELSPLLSKNSDDIRMNPDLFARVKTVYENQESMNLNKEQKKLLEETYKSFVRGGANLDAEQQARLRELNSEISMLQLTFGQNMLKETNAFQLIVDNKDDLAGLPESLVMNAEVAARSAGLKAKWFSRCIIRV